MNIKASNQLLFFLSFVLIDCGLIHGGETIFKYLFFIYCESTPTRLRHIRPPLAMRLSIMLKTLASPMSSDFLRGLWNHEFDAFAFLLLIKHVCICVYSFSYTGGVLESTFQFICIIWTKDMGVMLFLNTFSCFFFKEYFKGYTCFSKWTILILNCTEVWNVWIACVACSSKPASITIFHSIIHPLTIIILY